MKQKNFKSAVPGLSYSMTKPTSRYEQPEFVVKHDASGKSLWRGEIDPVHAVYFVALANQYFKGVDWSGMEASAEGREAHRAFRGALKGLVYAHGMGTGAVRYYPADKAPKDARRMG